MTEDVQFLYLGIIKNTEKNRKLKILYFSKDSEKSDFSDFQIRSPVFVFASTLVVDTFIAIGSFSGLAGESAI